MSELTQRVCFTLRIRSDRVAEYRARHLAVWPQMRQALSAAGWRNYSLFLGRDGLLVGYLECEDFDQARRDMEATEVNQTWQESVKDLFADLEDQAPDQAMEPLDLVFHLP